jgi:hypothetical protein
LTGEISCIHSLAVDTIKNLIVDIGGLFQSGNLRHGSIMKYASTDLQVARTCRANSPFQTPTSAIFLICAKSIKRAHISSRDFAEATTFSIADLSIYFSITCIGSFYSVFGESRFVGL